MPYKMYLTESGTATNIPQYRNQQANIYTREIREWTLPVLPHVAEWLSKNP